MRTRVVHEGAKYLEYAIRQIVEDAYRIRSLGVDITWENIGDPIAMGEKVEPWIAEIIHGLVDRSEAWAYCPSRGVVEAREFLAAQVNARGGVQIQPDDILFFNGIADAVDKVYDLIRKDARVLMPSPCYPTHSSNEAKRGEYETLWFHLDPSNGWQPDLDEMRTKVRYNPQIVAIAIVHPDNPTGFVYPRETLTEIVEIARQYGLFLICDEIYAHICYNGARVCHLSTVVEDVPALALRGISKEYPWPGARCGWVEMLNRGRDPQFDEYTHGLVLAKMMEVCSTTLPQMSIPRVFGDPRYPGHLARRAAIFEARAKEAYEAFRPIDELIVNELHGAFYFPVVFREGVLNDRQTLPIGNPRVREFVEQMVRGVPNDKRFVYYLLGSEGICVTPLSGFHSALEGFRITTLQADDDIRRDTLRRITRAIRRYLES